jgi:hypothetical protein
LFNEIADALERQAVRDKYEKQYAAWQKQMQNSLKTNAPNRWPDYYSFSVNVGGAAGVSGQVTVDRYGDLYFAPGGVFGKASTFLSGSLAEGWLDQQKVPSQASLQRFLTGNSYEIGAGFVAGFAENFSGNRHAREVEISSPQAGISYHHAWNVGNIFNW